MIFYKKLGRIMLVLLGVAIIAFPTTRASAAYFRSEYFKDDSTWTEFSGVRLIGYEQFWNGHWNNRDYAGPNSNNNSKPSYFTTPFYLSNNSMKFAGGDVDYLGVEGSECLADNFAGGNVNSCNPPIDTVTMTAPDGREIYFAYYTPSCGQVYDQPTHESWIEVRRPNDHWDIIRWSEICDVHDIPSNNIYKARWKYVPVNGQCGSNPTPTTGTKNSNLCNKGDATTVTENTAGTKIKIRSMLGLLACLICDGLATPSITDETFSIRMIPTLDSAPAAFMISESDISSPLFS